MTQDITHKRIWHIAGPIVLANATVPLLGAVNTGVVGQMGEAAPIGAVGMGAIILATVYWIFGFLRMGTSGLAAQAHGAGQQAEKTAILLRALGIALLAGMGLVLLQKPLIWGAFQIAPASAQVEVLAQDYLSIRIWGAPATIALYALTGWLIAVERAKAMVALQIWINLVNVGLDLWFVLGLGWGVKGVALATLIAEYSGLILALYLCREAFGPALGPALARFWDQGALRRMIAVNRDIMLRSVMLQLSFTSFVFLGARQGDVTLAANQVLLQFLEITAYALDGFAFSAETLVGQAVGARRPDLVKRASKLSLGWTFGGAIALAASFGFGGGAIIDLMAKDPLVQAEARLYLPWLFAAPILGAAAWTYDGVFIGATLTQQMRRIMFICVAIYASSLLILLPLLGNHGLWAALMILNLSRSYFMWRAAPLAENSAH